MVDTPGDNILSEFGSALNAVNGAIDIQRTLAIENDKLPDHRRMEFRIGINLGDVLHKDEMSILELARASDIPVLETPILPDELSAADEIFFSATPFKVLPVNRLEGVRFDVPGPVSTVLAERMGRVMAYADERFTRWFQPLF